MLVVDDQTAVGRLREGVDGSLDFTGVAHADGAELDTKRRCRRLDGLVLRLARLRNQNRARQART